MLSLEERANNLHKNSFSGEITPGIQDLRLIIARIGSAVGCIRCLLGELLR